MTWLHDMQNSPPLQFFRLADGEALNKMRSILEKDGVWHAPLERVFEIVKDIGCGGKGQRCKTVVLEPEYVDRDYADAFGKLYSRSFQPSSKMCRRLHFFGIDLFSEADLQIASPSKKADKKKRDGLQGAYLGFVVVRPSHPDTLGRTVIQPPQSRDGNQYFLCRNEYSLNLMGLPLKASGSPFLEQDRMVGACATAAIWTAHMSLYKQRGLRTYSTTEITEMADIVYPSPERVFPSSGLTVVQVGATLKKMGHETLILDLLGDDLQATISRLYPYIESEIPVILGIETGPERKHAITVIGHSLKTSPLSTFMGYTLHITRGGKKLANTLRYCSAAEWVDGLLLHDDQRGPYRRARFPAGSVQEGAQKGTAIVIEEDPIKDRNAEFPLLVAIVPLPRNVFLSGEEAEDRVAEILALMKNVQKGDSYLLGEEFDEDMIVLRTLLVESNEFKLRLDVKARGIDPSVGEWYRKRHLPKYIWLTEISRLSEWNVIPEKKRIIGEILLDPSSNPRRLEFISIYLDGKFWVWNSEDGDISEALERGPGSSQKWKSYKCYGRPSC